MFGEVILLIRVSKMHERFRARRFFSHFPHVISSQISFQSHPKDNFETRQKAVIHNNSQ